ncbi:MAG: DUF4214 domain-containing protein [Clostridiales bacterium]|nr:DUF4214 domain-containing protein [Clostridiales bacterium]
MKRKIFAAVGLCLALTLGSALVGGAKKSVRADEEEEKVVSEDIQDVVIDETTFPDPFFRMYVKENIDNGDGVLKKGEILSTKEIKTFEERIKDLTGIEYFTELELLFCSPEAFGSEPEERGNLSKLDVSKNTKLKGLICSGGKLTELDVSNNPDLLVLECNCNNITSLDLSKQTKLTELECACSPMETLIIGNNPDLAYLLCFDCKLTELDVSRFSKLVDLDCSQNKLSSLNVSNCTELVWLHCYNNQLTELDVSKNVNLETLDCDGNKLKELDLSKNENLMNCFIAHNQISKLDISKCRPLLEKLADPDTVQSEYEDRDDKTYQYLIGNSIILETDVGVELIPSFEEIKKRGPITPAPEKEPTIGDFVERLYTEALGRPSEEAGKKYWIGEITSGRKTGADCGLFFLLGEEFTNKKLSEEELVETLYKTFFGRESEPDGKAYWVGQLKNGVSRESVVRGFIDSKEWCNLCADYGVRSGAPTAKAERPSKKANAFATRLYICCLGRDPEEAGLQYWALALTNLEKTGAEAAKQFFGSAEFVNLATTDEEYVTRLYTTFMDREPEEGGFAYWVGQLKQGVSREQVLAAFAVSPEFTQICADYGIERGTV